MLTMDALKAGAFGEPVTTVRISRPLPAMTKLSFSTGPPSLPEFKSLAEIAPKNG
jgi:hypothetical protein